MLFGRVARSSEELTRSNTIARQAVGRHSSTFVKSIRENIRSGFSLKFLSFRSCFAPSYIYNEKHINACCRGKADKQLSHTMQMPAREERETRLILFIRYIDDVHIQTPTRRTDTK